MDIVLSFKVFLCYVLLVTVLVKESWAQKGGAKGAMRNRGKEGVEGEGGGGGHHAEADDDDIRKMKTKSKKCITLFAGADIREKYDCSKPRACVGLCFNR
jgi:hypothetical protein